MGKSKNNFQHSAAYERNAKLYVQSVVETNRK